MVDVSFMLNNVPIIKADNAVHLGHYIGKNFNEGNISQGVSNLISRTNTMLRSLICVPHLLNLHLLIRIVLVIMVVCCGL